nr:hypothetical protein [Halocella sp. SP3-1]
MARKFIQRISDGFIMKEIIRWAITLKDQDRVIGIYDPRPRARGTII